MSSTTNEIAALSRLFSPTVFRELAMRGRSPLFARLFGQLGDWSRGLACETVSTVFDSAYAVLQTVGLRNEYVFRTAITQNILLGRHSLNTATMLTEFRAGSSKADLVILNGTSTVYEIKSDRDSLARLAQQLANYRKLFAMIYVIAAEAHVEHVLRGTSQEVGVMQLTRRGRIHTVREASDRSTEVCPVSIYESLRFAEARDILLDLRISIPDVSPTKMHRAMRDQFAKLEPKALHDRMVTALRRTRNLKPFASLVSALPRSLHAAALSTKLRRSDHQRLVYAMQTPVAEAIRLA